MIKAYWSYYLSYMQLTYFLFFLSECFFSIFFTTGFLFLIILSKYYSLGQLNFPISLNFYFMYMCLRAGRSSCRYFGILFRLGLMTVFHYWPSQYFGRGNLFMTRSSSIYCTDNIILQNILYYKSCRKINMQNFKQISYQNYIQLRFNQKNLQQTEQQEALLKYKRNAQLLAQIFSFEKKPKNTFIAQPVITEQHLKQLEEEVEKQKKEGQLKCKQIEDKSKNYCIILKKIKNIKTEQQRNLIINQLKAADLYDGKHPYFAENSPFFMNNTEEEVLQVSGKVQIPEESTLTLMQIK